MTKGLLVRLCQLGNKKGHVVRQLLILDLLGLPMFHRSPLFDLHSLTTSLCILQSSQGCCRISLQEYTSSTARTCKLGDGPSS